MLDAQNQPTLIGEPDEDEAPPGPAPASTKRQGGRGRPRGPGRRPHRDRRPGPDVPQGDRQGRAAHRRGRGRPGQGDRARRAGGRGPGARAGQPLHLGHTRLRAEGSQHGRHARLRPAEGGAARHRATRSTGGPGASARRSSRRRSSSPRRAVPPDLDDEARERIMDAESIIKLLATDPAEALKQTRSCSGTRIGSERSTTPERSSSTSSSAGRARRPRTSSRDYIEYGNDADYLLEPRLRPVHPAGRPAREALRTPGRAERRRAQAPDRGQPAAGGQHRQEVHRARHELPGPHPGGQHRPHPGGREVRLREGLQVQHVRHVVDPAGDHARHRRPGADDPHPGPHGRDDQPPDPRQPHAAPGARAASRRWRRSPGA